jgi:hypothetical protein
MQPRAETVRFHLKSGPVTVDKDALEQMKRALQSFVEGPMLPAQFHELREAMLAELQSSAIWIQGQEAGIGVWRLEDRDDRLKLVRYPEVSRTRAYLYLAPVERTDSGWKVTSLEQEREFGPI